MFIEYREYQQIIVLLLFPAWHTDSSKSFLIFMADSEFEDSMWNL